MYKRQDLAASVFDTYMTGIYYRNVPKDLNHGHQQTLVLSLIHISYSEVWKVSDKEIAGWEIMERTGRRPKDTPCLLYTSGNTIIV